MMGVNLPSFGQPMNPALLQALYGQALAPQMPNGQRKQAGGAPMLPNMSAPQQAQSQPSMLQTLMGNPQGLAQLAMMMRSGSNQPTLDPKKAISGQIAPPPTPGSFDWSRYMGGSQ